MNLGNFSIVKSYNIKFSLKMVKIVSDPPMYHWLWFIFDFYNKNAYKIKCLEKRMDFMRREIENSQRLICYLYEKENQDK